MGAGGGEDINYGSTVWAAPVPLPCSRRLYLHCVIPQRLYAAWCRQVGQENSKTKNKPAKNDENKTRTQDAIYPAVF